MSRDVRRVLHIIPGFGGGISSHVRNIINSIDDKKLIIDVAGFTEYPTEFATEVENKNGKVYVLKNVRIKTLFENIKQYRRILNRGNYDAVHMHLTDVQAAYFSTLSRSCGVRRIVSHAHIADQPGSATTFFKLKMFFQKSLTVCVASDLASCSKIASEFRFGKKYVNNNLVMHLPNSISVDKYFEEFSVEEQMKYLDELKIRNDDIVIGNVGYFGYQKNYPGMLEIIKCLKEKRINFVWLMIGTGRDFDYIVNKAKEMNISDCIRFLGRRSDVHKLYKIMDVSVLTSHYEGLPTVTIETQAAGTPTVISDTIADETEMGLGMIKRISLNEPAAVWVDTILEQVKVQIPDAEIRYNSIQKRCFTSETAAELYTKFINKAILHYNLGDEVDWRNN